MAAQMLRRFGLKKADVKENETRIRLQKELFSFNKCVDQGFPHKPTAVAFDHKLSLLAIGTKSGTLRIYGKPGVEYVGEHEEEVSILYLQFISAKGKIITFTSDNCIHSWTIGEHDEGRSLVRTHTYAIEPSKLKSISTCCITDYRILFGNEQGQVHIFDLEEFTLNIDFISTEKLTEKVEGHLQNNTEAGAVESIVQHPQYANKFLIGFNRGLIIYWDIDKDQQHSSYSASQQLESLSWQRDGEHFVSTHNDGSYTVWTVEEEPGPPDAATTPYGPFPCKAISKMVWKSTKSEPFLIFSGGMPRASYGDKHTITVIAAVHVVFEVTSKIIDFVVITSDSADDEYDVVDSLLILTEEEIIAVDLSSEDASDTYWPLYPLPYLSSIHASAITTAAHATNVPADFLEKLRQVGQTQMPNVSTRDWPITGGNFTCNNYISRDILLTGHEDGTVRFWDVSTTCLSLIYTLKTISLFNDMPTNANTSFLDADEEWPPFRKVGTFDPFTDDTRLAIQKLCFCPYSETLAIGGTAGQIVLFELSRESRNIDLRCSQMSLITEREGFQWKGHRALMVLHDEDRVFPAGFQPITCIQVSPPAACTALVTQPEWQLLAVGTSHGFGVFDYVQKKQICSQCTLNPNDNSVNDHPISRRKSFKKSLRESFRRLRHRRSQNITSNNARNNSNANNNNNNTTTTSSSSSPGSPANRVSIGKRGRTIGDDGTPNSGDSPKPVVERHIEARGRDDTMTSMVRCLYFAKTYVVNGVSPSLWAGTNQGTVYVYQISEHSSDARDTEPVHCVLAKELQLKHRAPIIDINVLDRHSQPLPPALAVYHEAAKPADMSSGGHHVVITSEEQFKIFSLPSLKPTIKYKLTAHDGSRVRKVGYVNFRSKNDERYCENDLVCLTNLGELMIFTLPNLRCQLKASCVKKDNVCAIVSNVFANNGNGCYLSSPSEFVRYSLSARYQHPKLDLDLNNINSASDSHPVEGDEDEEEASTTADITIDSVKDHREDEQEMSTIQTEYMVKQEIEVKVEDQRSDDRPPPINYASFPTEI